MTLKKTRTDDPYKELRCESCKAEPESDPSTCTECIQIHKDYAAAMGLPDPITQIDVHCTYYAGTSTNLKLPLHKTWKDVEDVYIKWNTLHIKFKGEEEWGEYDLDSHVEPDDMKRPVSYSILNEEGDYLKESS